MGNSTIKGDPFKKPATSLSNRFARVLWGIFYIVLFRSSPRPFHAWRSFLLRCFGAKLGSCCHNYPKAIFWAPWNLVCEDLVAIADDAVIYNPKTVTIMSHATISQEAYLCGATHVKPEQIHYERLVNPVTIPDGPVKEVTGYLNHYPFSKGISHWLDRHNSYSTLEAKQIINNHAKFSIKKSLFSKDFNERRFNQKEKFYRLPGRPFIKFLILYIGKRGFFDGKAGFTYAVLQSFYEYMIVLKTREIAEKKLEWI